MSGCSASGSAAWNKGLWVCGELGWAGKAFKDQQKGKGSGWLLLSAFSC